MPVQDDEGPYEAYRSPSARYSDYGEPSSYDGQSRGSERNGDRHRERSHRESDREREKTRDKDRERRYRDERDHGRDRERSDRDRDRERHRSHERDRGSRDYDRDRERRHRHRSHSRGRSRDYSRSRSRSRSKSRERRKRASGFDMAPPGAAVLQGQIPVIAASVPGVFPGMFPFGGTQFTGLPVMPAQAMTQQATRHARRVYVGGLPPHANEQTIATYFSQVMAAIGGNTAGPGDAVVNVYINHEKKFAFVEMRTVEEASNAMALDGIMFEGVQVRVRRPSDYNPSMAATLGPSQPSPHLNLAAVGLTPGCAAAGADGPDRVFVGGLPYYLTETQIKELLESFGQLRGFDLVKDRDTGNSKGYGFCVYQDPAVTDVACAALNGLKMGDKTLTVRRATASGQPKPDQANVMAQAQHQIAMQKMAMQTPGANPLGVTGLSPFMTGLSGMMPGMIPGMTNGFSAVAETPTRVLCLAQIVSAEELRDDEEYSDIFEDMRDECGKYGTVVNLVIPRPKSNGEVIPGVGKVFVEYSEQDAAVKAKAALNGRKFGGNHVIVNFYSEEKFARADFDS